MAKKGKENEKKNARILQHSHYFINLPRYADYVNMHWNDKVMIWINNTWDYTGKDSDRILRDNI